MRHLLAGVPTRVVASYHHMSVAMIERDHTDALTRRGLLDFDPSLPVGKVLQWRSCACGPRTGAQ
jgi:hypothetical protein